MGTETLETLETLVTLRPINLNISPNPNPNINRSVSREQGSKGASTHEAGTPRHGTGRLGGSALA